MQLNIFMLFLHAFGDLKYIYYNNLIKVLILGAINHDKLATKQKKCVIRFFLIVWQDYTPVEILLNLC